MERNLMGELSMYRQSGTTPNFSEMARRHGMDRKTVARCWRSGGDLEDRRWEGVSGFARHDGVIRARIHSVIGYLGSAEFEEANWPRENSHSKAA